MNIKNMTIEQVYKDHEKTGNLYIGNNGKFTKIDKAEAFKKVLNACQDVFPNAYIPPFRG